MKNISKILAVCLSVLLVFCSCGKTNTVTHDDNGGQQEEIVEKDFVEGVSGVLSVQGSDVVYPEELWSAPDFGYESTLDFGGENTEGVKGIFFTWPIRYKGKPTRVAAYIGFPSYASATDKVPAIVLVHGGLGTAVPQWVKYWNDLGFAAISMDTEGAEPTAGISNENTGDYHRDRNRYAGGQFYEAGPTNNGFSDWDKPLEDQWMYHATSAVILSTSLISSFDCVDKTKVGITGISWGSVITSIVLKYDYRLKFAMPVYGGITQSQSSGESSNRHPNETSVARWDTIDGIVGINCKTFYVNSDADRFFSMDIADRCSKATGGSLTYIHGLSHGQSEGANEENLPNFAKFCCGMKTTFVTMLFSPGLVPTYILITQYLKWRNSLLALIVPGLGGSFYIILMRTFFADVPKEISDSAKIDGCSNFGIFLRIIMPLSTPALATCAVLFSLNYWNDWYSSFLYIESRESFLRSRLRLRRRVARRVRERPPTRYGISCTRAAVLWKIATG